MVSHGCIYDQVILRVVCIEFGVEWDCKEEEGVEHLRVWLALIHAIVHPYHKHVSSP